MSKRRHVLIFISKEKTNQKDHVSFDLKVVLPEKYELSPIINVIDQASFVEGLDSKMSLSQLGENDIVHLRFNP